MLKDIRKSKHLTQEALARKSGVSLPTVGRIERGENCPSVTTAQRIAAALEIDWVQLFASTPAQLPLRDKGTTTKEAATCQSTRKKTCEKPVKRKD